MERFWLKSDPPGVPADIDLTRYASLVQLMEESFAKYAGRTAYAFMGSPITTVHAPQSPSLQPSLVPFRPRVSRSQSRSVRVGLSPETCTGVPFNRNATVIRLSAAVSPVGALCVVARCGVKRPTRPFFWLSLHQEGRTDSRQEQTLPEKAKLFEGFAEISGETDRFRKLTLR